MKKVIPALVAIVLIIIIGAIAFGGELMEKYSYSNEGADLYEHFNLKDISQIAIIENNALLEEQAYLLDGRCYFSYETVLNHINDRFYIDKEEELLLFTTPTQIISAAMDGSTYKTDGEEKDAGYKIWFQKGTYYIAADFLKQYTNYSYELYLDPNRVLIDKNFREQEAADAKKATAVRVKGGVKSPVLKNISEGDTLVILERMETWCKVMTGDGFIGYVENKVLNDAYTKKPDPVTDYEEPEYTSLTEDKKISIGWHAIYSVGGNDTLNEVAGNAAGMDVIAPTWYSVSDCYGSLRSFASPSYVEKAHEKGLKVWGVVDDFNQEDTVGEDVDVPLLLSRTTSRTMLIDNIMSEAKAAGLDGINIDFERINTAEAGADFVQFLRELSIRCRREGLVLSVDNYVPYDFNSRYDLEEQGVVADYVIIMAYDEHWAGCEEAGSVSSAEYVKYSIDKTMQYVPENKIITALPFYTRLWKTTGAKVSSEAYAMTGVDTVLNTYGMTAEWDDATSQNYAEVTQGDTLYQMWIEDLQSINVKINIMKNYKLGGVAAWRLGYEPASVWELLEAYTAQ